ncbi:MAG: Mur ligase family protein, partial [Vicinamibacterales bacterium]
MTWDELRGALRTAGLHRIDEGVAADTGALFVTGLAWDSRAVEPGNVFIALKGLRADGNLFATQAVSRGAVAIVSEQPPPANVDVPWVTVPDARLALALLAITFYGNPSAEMQVVGITGTNGKTTTAYLMASIFEAAGIRCGIVGTVAHKVGDELREATRTTPEAPEIQGLLRDMVAA